MSFLYHIKLFFILVTSRKVHSNCRNTAELITDTTTNGVLGESVSPFNWERSSYVRSDEMLIYLTNATAISCFIFYKFRKRLSPEQVYYNSCISCLP